MLLVAAMAMASFACTASKPEVQPTVAPVADETAAPVADETPVPEQNTPAPEPDVQPTIDVTGDWYSDFYGILQVLTLNANGTYAMLSPEISDEAITGSWEMQDGAIVLDSGMLYQPITIENDTLVWTDLLSNRIVFTREQPETGYTSTDPVTDLNDSAFLGVWDAKFIADASGIALSTEALGIVLTLSINADEIVFDMNTGNGPEQLKIPYTIENGVLTFTMTHEGESTVVHLTMQSDGNLAMTMEGEENAGIKYILAPGV